MRQRAHMFGDERLCIYAATHSQILIFVARLPLGCGSALSGAAAHQSINSLLREVVDDVEKEDVVNIPLLSLRKNWKLTNSVARVVDSWEVFSGLAGYPGVEVQRWRSKAFCSLLSCEDQQTGLQLLELRRGPTEVAAASDIPKHALLLIPLTFSRNVSIGPLPPKMPKGACVLQQTFEADGILNHIMLTALPAQFDDAEKAKRRLLVPFWLTPFHDSDFNMEWCEVPSHAALESSSAAARSGAATRCALTSSSICSSFGAVGRGDAPMNTFVCMYMHLALLLAGAGGGWNGDPCHPEQSRHSSWPSLGARRSSQQRNDARRCLG